jgi:hypothetical protein
LDCHCDVSGRLCLDLWNSLPLKKVTEVGLSFMSRNSLIHCFFQYTLGLPSSQFIRVGKGGRSNIEA